MANSDPFSMSTMLNSLQQEQLRFSTATEPTNPTVAPPPPPPRGIPMAIPPPGFTQPCGTLQELEMRLQWMFNLMTNNEEDDDNAPPFKEMISKLDRRELQGMASLLTSDSDYFLEIARNNNGSNRLQILLGKSDDVDAFISAAILRRFLHVMTDKNALYVAIRGLRVFDEENKESFYEQILHHALRLASHRYGCISLNNIKTDLDHPYYREQLLEVLAQNALWLSNDASGNFVVQHLLKQNNLRCTKDIAINLYGHCVDLSFKKYGSYIVEKLLEKEESMGVVVLELLKCDGDRLMRLARHEFGNFVVGKALRVTQKDMNRAHQFRALVNKLVPFLQFFRRSRGSNIAAILESVL
ncbi:hypothetical protein EUTSA_v10015341mg [Eutrema salsugineum]|uniref:PUM-HD domain-containing protein n=1 Tax=Eutrema salsugineum TaxID=72664 RepID=V4LRC9_EUTSA|nr:hypothetical protein EUTSA_v10015341mg [Eutrema salsugineum]